MSHPTAITIHVQLDGSNYREWAFCVETVLGGYGLVNILLAPNQLLQLMVLMLVF